MRNSIQGPLLRTGHNSSFKALGETGYPVFKMAFQLREAIYRLDAGRDLARHLAIPQNDQGGDRTDWYSSFPGDVIPWSGASENERASARQQFTEFQLAVHSLSEQLFNAEQNGTGGDRRVFAQLLKSVVHFPDYDFVYLVDGILVITFWGFIHPTGVQRNPMHWLEASSVPQPTTSPLVSENAAIPSAINSTTAPVFETPLRSRRWNWRWLLLPLLGLLLLALLFGLLRGCAPVASLFGTPTLSADNAVSHSASHADIPHVTGSQNPQRSDVNVRTLAREKGSVVSTSAEHVHVPGAALNTVKHSADSTVMPLNDTDSPGVDSLPVDHPDSDNIGTPANQNAPTTESQSQDVVSKAPPSVPAQGEPLTLPPALPDGPADFLNGQWRVNGGIQDKLTGRPLQLQYNFAQGNGTVSVRQSSGITCTGSAKGNMQQGALNITNSEQMTCSDGSNFIVPDIECKSPASGHADCVGSNNGEKTFPIRMLQPNT